MPQAPVTPDIHQTADIERDIATQRAFNLIVVFDALAKLRDLPVGQVPYAGFRIDPGRFKHLAGSCESDTEYVGDADLHAFVAGQIDPGNTCHHSLLGNESLLSLPLFVARVPTKYPYDASAADDFAVFTDFFYRSAYFHLLVLSFGLFPVITLYRPKTGSRMQSIPGFTCNDT
jgi:hypothetical protein